MHEHFRHSSLHQTRPIRADFIITTAYLIRNLGLFPTSVIFQVFVLLNSIVVLVNTWKLEHGFVEFLGIEADKARLHGHILTKIPYRSIVSELDFFKNQIRTNQVWYQGENRILKA